MTNEKKKNFAITSLSVDGADLMSHVFEFNRLFLVRSDFYSKLIKRSR